MRKTFKTTLRPPHEAPAPSLDDAIAVFVQHGAGKDQSTETQKSVNAPFREDVITEPQISVKPPPLKRLTLDLPEDLHARYKLACVRGRRTMVEDLRAFIERRCAELEAE